MSTDNSQWHSGAPEKVYDTIRRLDNMLSPLRVIDSMLNRQYFASPDSPDPMSIAAGNLERIIAEQIRKRGGFNLLKSAIDSYCAMVVQVPSIDVTTTGGGYAERKSAESLGYFIDGTFAANGLKGTAWSCVIDSCLSRVAAVEVDFDEKIGAVIERLAPHWLYWNPAEGQKPRNLFVCRPYPRGSALAKWGDDPVKKDAIMACPQYRPDQLFEGIDGTFFERESDMIGLYEGHRTAEGDDLGRTVVGIMTDGGWKTLTDAGNTLTRHRIVPLRYSPSYNSFAGSPAGDVLIHYQKEMDDFASTIKETFVKGGVFRVIVDNTAGVDEKELDDTQGRIVHKNPNSTVAFDRGIAPTPEYINREDVIIRRAFDFLGVSYNSARGVKADGISSAKGQREVAALAQNRLVLNMQTLQDWFVEIAKTEIAVVDARADKKKGISIKVPGSRQLRRVNWNEISGDKQEDYDVHCDAINALSRHPAARIDEVLELTQGGILDEREGLKAIGVKDLQAVRDQAFSNEDFADQVIDLALSGDFRAPDPYMGEDGLKMLIKKGRQSYIHECVQKKPSAHLGLLRRLIECAKTELSKMTPVPPPLAGPMDAPGPAGGPPPTGADLAVPGAGLPADLPPAATGAPVPGQGLA